VEKKENLARMICRTMNARSATSRYRTLYNSDSDKNTEKLFNFWYTDCAISKRKTGIRQQNETAKNKKTKTRFIILFKTDLCVKMVENFEFGTPKSRRTDSVNKVNEFEPDSVVLWV